MEVSERLRRSSGELVAVAILLLDLIWWRAFLPAALALAFLLWFFFRYRREAVLSYCHSEPVRCRMALADIRDIERKYTRRDDYNSPEKRALVRKGLDRYFYYVRYERVQALLDTFAADSKRVLDMGCGFGRNTLYVAENLKRPAVGLDLDDLKLAWAASEASRHGTIGNVGFVCADAALPPLRAGSFECIVMTEALEHLISPAQGLAACHELLLPGGILIITVPSRHNLAYSINPFIVLEKIVSLVDDRVLPPYHGLHARFEYDRHNPEPQYGMHYNFSGQRLEGLLSQAGFSTIRRESFEIEIFPYLAIEFLCQGDVQRMKRLVAPLEALVTRLPVIGRMGQHLVWVARKEDSGRKAFLTSFCSQ